MRALHLFRLLQYHTVRSYAPSSHRVFAIVFLPRTGSNLLAGMLDSHPDVLCHHEIFNPDAVHRALSYKDTPLSFGTVAERDADPFAFLSRVLGFADGHSAVGFKIGPIQNYLVLLSVLLCRRVRKIVLTRRNQLQAYTSTIIATQTRIWSQHEHSSRPRQGGNPKVTVDVHDLRRFVRKRQAFEAAVLAILRITAQDFLRIDYDDIANPAVLRGVLKFVGVRSDITLTARTLKQNPATLRDRIENYDEIASALAKTRFAAFLD